MPSDERFSEEKIKKMLETSRSKPVPPHILKGFKEEVMRRIETAPAPEAKPAFRPGRWIATHWRLPRVQVGVGVGAFACLLIASLAVLTTDRRQPPVRNEVFQVASVPAAGPASAALSNLAAPAYTTGAAARSAAAPAAAVKRALTVEEELRLIEEFDTRRFFIRQDISEDDLASA